MELTWILGTTSWRDCNAIFSAKKNSETSPQMEAKRTKQSRRVEPKRTLAASEEAAWEGSKRGQHTAGGGGFRKQSVECMRFVYKQKINKPPGWRRCHWSRVEWNCLAISLDQRRTGHLCLWLMIREEQGTYSMSMVNGERSVALLASHWSHLTCSQQVFWHEAGRAGRHLHVRRVAFLVVRIRIRYMQHMQHAAYNMFTFLH